MEEASSKHEEHSTISASDLLEKERNCSLFAPASAEGHRHFDGLYDRPLSCFGCGIGWFCFIFGFAFPLLWYVATTLYIGKFYLRDPRERAGLAASAIAALICTAALLITFLVLIFSPAKISSN